MDESHRGWQRVRVVGPSMVPTVSDGDLIMVRMGAFIRAGDVVLARFRSMPDRVVVKRATRTSEGGWWLSSDNGFAGGDSAVHGVAEVLGRAVLRIPAGGRVAPSDQVAGIRSVVTCRTSESDQPYVLGG